MKVGVVEDLQSIFAASAFLVKKPVKQWRMVVDNTKLNENMKPDRFPFSWVYTIFDILRTATYFSWIQTMYSIRLEDRGFSVFVTHKGLYQIY